MHRYMCLSIHPDQASIPREDERGCLVRQEDLGQNGSPPEPQFLPLSNGDNRLALTMHNQIK